MAFQSFFISWYLKSLFLVNDSCAVHVFLMSMMLSLKPLIVLEFWNVLMYGVQIGFVQPTVKFIESALLASDVTCESD